MYIAMLIYLKDYYVDLESLYPYTSGATGDDSMPCRYV